MLRTFATTALVLFTSLFPVCANDEIEIELFSKPTHKWSALNDPVMGGKSSSSVTIDKTGGLGIFDGKVVDVPFLQAPGFIQMETRGGSYPDVSSCKGIKLKLMSTTEYGGYRVSFGNVHVPGGRYAFGYKADFDAPLGSFDDVLIPFDKFSAKWDDATGDQIVTCDEDPQYCPDVTTLKNMKTFAIWGEGVAGDVHLEIESISAFECLATSNESNLIETNQSEEDEIMIESFDNPVLFWTEMNDPVMGGKSTGTFKVEDGLGHFHGKVADVPFLHAPGFITAAGTGPFQDVSSCSALKLTVRNLEEYSGFRVSFGVKRPPHNFIYARGFKANFDVPAGVESFTDIIIPFDEFSDKWDAATGDQIVSCHENSAFCPDEETLQDMKTISVWGEGVAGDINLEIKSISAIGCSSNSPGKATSQKERQLSHPQFAGAFFVGMVFVLGINKFVSKRRKAMYEEIGRTGDN